MIFSVAIIFIAGVVAYFHYVQGFFSGALSAILSILAAALAVSYHEPLSKMMMGGKFTDQATALSLLGIYVGVYVVGRIIFDKAVPGNIRLPVGFEKAGAAAVGAVAGVFCAGIVAIAAQSMPFGVAIAGYSRFATIDTESMQTAGNRGVMNDESIHDVLKNDHLDPADASSLLLPADDIVMGVVKKLSDGGALAGAQDLAIVHPNYLTELFGQRLGVQTGAHHVAYNTDKEKQVELKGLFTVDSLPQGDGEVGTMKGRWADTKGLPAKVTSDAGKIIIIARLQFARGATDADNSVRVSTGGVRLVGNGKDYAPIGTLSMTDGMVLRAQRPDDFLFLPSDGVGDFVFHLDRSDFGLTDDKSNNPTMPPDVFIEAKRLGYIDLSNMAISRSLTPQGSPSFLRKKGLPGVAGAAAPSGGSTPVAGGPLDVGKIDANAMLFSDIALGTLPADGAEATLRSGKATIKDGKISKLTIEPTDSLTLLKQGESPVRELWASPGQKLYRVAGSVPSSATDKWEWAGKLTQFELVDADGTSYKPCGAVARVKAGITDKMVARYDATGTIDSLNGGGELRPTDVYLYFAVPDSRKPTDLKFAGKVLKHLG